MSTVQAKMRFADSVSLSLTLDFACTFYPLHRLTAYIDMYTVHIRLPYAVHIHFHIRTIFTYTCTIKPHANTSSIWEHLLTATPAYNGDSFIMFCCWGYMLMALNTSGWGAMRDRAHTVEHATHQYIYIIYARMITDAYK